MTKGQAAIVIVILSVGLAGVGAMTFVAMKQPQVTAPTSPVDAGPEVVSAAMASLISFEGRASECVAVSVASTDPAAVDRAIRLARERAASEGQTLLPSNDCAQFAGRTVLARCEFTMPARVVDGGAMLGAGGQSVYLDMAAMEASGDQWMRDCAGMGGTWWELPRDDRAYRRAHMEMLARQANALADEFGR
jgi:hypothetical protein